MSIYIVLFCSWLVMSEAAMLTLVLMSLFWCPVTPSGVDRGQHHPALFAEALTITPENISTPDKPAQMLRQKGSPRPKVVQLSVLIGLIFSPGFLFASFAVTRQSQCCCCGKDTDEPSHRVPSGRIAAGHAGQAKKKTDWVISHLSPRVSGAGVHRVWPIRELRAVCVLWAPTRLKFPVSANYTVDLMILSFYSLQD